MTRHIYAYGLKKIKQWEGLRTEAYKDQAGIWTIGYGHTAQAGYPYPQENMRISVEEAENILISDLMAYEECVDNAVHVPLKDNQFAALVSFCYNVGTQAFLRSTLLKKLNKGAYDAVSQELMKWVKCKGKTLPGLVNRRHAENALWLKGDFVASNFIHADNKQNNLLNPSVLLPSLTSLSGLASFVSGNGPFQWVLAFIALATFIVGLGYFYSRHKKTFP